MSDVELKSCPKCNDCWALIRLPKEPPLQLEYIRCGRCGFNAPIKSWQARVPSSVKVDAEEDKNSAWARNAAMAFQDELRRLNVNNAHYCTITIPGWESLAQLIVERYKNSGEGGTEPFSRTVGDLKTVTPPLAMEADAQLAAQLRTVLQEGFMIGHSHGPSKDYQVQLKFRSLKESHRAHNLLLAITDPESLPSLIKQGLITISLPSSEYQRELAELLDRVVILPQPHGDCASDNCSACAEVQSASDSARAIRSRASGG